ncbi:ornithine cyclodeaminase [Aeromicrobium endophyticum]|uniref:Ornithine cyclodeaminase n=1 Tax=Aeromicrobium endophyticum TaxID=2292704 RepID=A0A371P524_9ACTN|nr:ornithine cyclodeaminase [Aeromicrobium endophyticum]REK70955.1 ornithine cyclodeaminase [Aeromicrobium endophyticum]
MTQFVDVHRMRRWVAGMQVENVLEGLRTYIEDDFRRWPRFDKVARVASHTPFGVIELMPTSDHETYGFKYVNGHPDNPERGFQTVTAFGVLADVHNGYPTFMSEMTILTALRTAATSAMVAKALARPGSATMALIGTGSQAEFQALAMRGALGIEDLRIWDTDPAAMLKLARNLEPRGFDVTIAGSAREAAQCSDVITTCTADKTRATVLDLDMIPQGAHVNTIGGDCPGKTELDPRIVTHADVFVEYEPQTRVEGEIQALPADSPVTEFWRVLVGDAPGRTSREQITVFDSVGFAIEDFAALRFVRDSTAHTDFSTTIDLVAQPDDPKDLFGYATAPSPVPV